MACLSDWAADVYSQDGEDGMITEIFRRIGDGGRVCVEFGAGNGIDGANTAHLWRRPKAWSGLLIEADHNLYTQARRAADGFPVTVACAAVSATDRDLSIDVLLDEFGIRTVDFMSVDVDGDDYWIVCGMKIRPRVLCVEYNRSVPPHLDLLPSGPGNRFGVGAATLRRAVEQRGYRMVGLTANNLFFVRTDEAAAFDDLETDLAVLLPPDRFAYLCTDQTGRPVLCGTPPPWGLRWPASDTDFVTNQLGLLEAAGSDMATWRDVVLQKLELLSQQMHTEVDWVRQKLEGRT